MSVFCRDLYSPLVFCLFFFAVSGMLLGISKEPLGITWSVTPPPGKLRHAGCAARFRSGNSGALPLTGCLTQRNMSPPLALSHTNRPANAPNDTFSATQACVNCCCHCRNRGDTVTLHLIASRHHTGSNTHTTEQPSGHGYKSFGASIGY